VAGPDGLSPNSMICGVARAPRRLFFTRSICLSMMARTFAIGPCWSARRRWGSCYREATPIVLNEHLAIEGAVVFEHACMLGAEGIVSKRLGSPYAAPSPAALARRKKMPGGYLLRDANRQAIAYVYRRATARPTRCTPRS
jgi:hypothetical protein